MHFATVSLFVVGLACVYGAPAEAPKPAAAPKAAEAPVAQEKFVNDVKQAFEPVAVQVRGLFDTAEKGIETVGSEAAKAGERLMDSAKQILNSVQHTDRANLPNDLKDRMAGIKDELQQDVRALLVKASESADPIKTNLRSIAMSARDAMEMLEGKYLTEDGKDLMRSLAAMVKTQLKVPQAIADAAQQ